MGPASGGSKREGEKRARSARWAGRKRASQAAPAIGWNPNRASLRSIFEAGSLVRVPGAPARRPRQSAWPLTYASCKTTHEIGGVGRRLEGARVGRPRPGHPRDRVPHRWRRAKSKRPAGRGRLRRATGRQKGKTYNSGYSHVVTHRTTSPPVRSLSSGERTGSSVLCDLWSYVLEMPRGKHIYLPTRPRTAAGLVPLPPVKVRSRAGPHPRRETALVGCPGRRAVASSGHRWAAEGCGGLWRAPVDSGGPRWEGVGLWWAVVGCGFGA